MDTQNQAERAPAQHSYWSSLFRHTHLFTRETDEILERRSIGASKWVCKLNVELTFLQATLALESAMLTTDYIQLAVFLASFFVCLGAVTWQATSSKQLKWHRIYWGASGLFMWVGAAGAALFLIVPPERFDTEGRLIGEMPPEFGFAGAIAQLGFYLALAGFIAIGLARLSRIARSRHGGNH